MLKMYHRHEGDGQSPAFWEEFGSEGSFEARLRFAATDPLRPLFERYARPGTRMLEGGCGQGQYVAFYTARGVKVLGLDFARDWLRRLRKRDANLALCVGDVAALPCATDAFDVYYSGGVVEHFEAGCQPALLEARRVLKRDGTLLISVPYFSPLRRLLSWFRRSDWKRVPSARREPPGAGLTFFQYCYTPAEFTRELEAAGLRVVSTQGYAILWGLHDIPAFQGLVSRLSATKERAPSAAGSPPGTGEGASLAAPAPAEGPGGVRGLLKALLVAEDDTVPLGGLIVKLGRWACANMMMYVCVRDERVEPGAARTS